VVALRSFDTEPDPVPPGHGESDPRRDGRGSNVYEAWEYDPTPVPATPTEEIPWP
jgi:hypothetical protein